MSHPWDRVTHAMGRALQRIADGAPAKAQLRTYEVLEKDGYIRTGTAGWRVTAAGERYLAELRKRATERRSGAT